MAETDKKSAPAAVEKPNVNIVSAAKVTSPASSGFVQDMLKKVTDMQESMQAVYAERGFEPFKMPVLVTLGMCCALYFVLYKPLGPKIDDISYQLDTQRTISESLSEYNDTKASIIGYKKKLPMYKDKDDWLNYLIISSAKELGIEIETLQPQKITESGNFAIASRDVETTLDYNTAGYWVEKLENAPVFLRITSFDLSKIQEAPTMVKLKMTVSTMFVKE